MKKIFKYVAILLTAFLFFGGAVFIKAYFAKFIVDVPSVDVELAPLASSETDFTVSFDPSFVVTGDEDEGAEFEEVGPYAIRTSDICNQYDENYENCIDQVPNLCPYISLIPKSGEVSETGFSNFSGGPQATGELDKENDEADLWTLRVDAPCFEGECPDDYYYIPEPQSLKGEVFQCDLRVESNAPIVQVKNSLGPKIALADADTNVIHVSGKFGGEVATHDPVILIPGITGSYLFKDYGNEGEIWPNVVELFLSLPDGFLNDLSLNLDGSEKPSFPIKVGDIIREESGSHVFDYLIQDLENEGYVEGKDLFVFPYDWRISNGYNAILLSEKIESILEQTSSEKIDIVAHSMGGVLAKTYIAEDDIGVVDQLIFLGTPHLGAPKAFKALMYGDDMGFGLDLFGGSSNDIRFLNPQQLKTISQNMPAVYELLPSQKYISDNGGYVINQQNENNPVTLNYAETKNKMIADGRNIAMFPFAENLHDDVDNLDLSGVEVHNFVGCGGKTLGEITFKRKLSWVGSSFQMADDFDINYVNGDSTVPQVSADAVESGMTYFAKGISHGSMPSANGIKEAVAAILKREEVPPHESILSTDEDCNISGKNVSVHSPVELHIYDEEGNHAGPLENGDIENEIPGVEYDVIGGEKFAFLPDGENYRVVTKATDTGGYDLVVKSQNENDEIISTDEWKLIPLETIEAEGEMMVGPNHPREEYEIAMDNDGNGVVDETVEPTPPPGPFYYLEVLRSFIKSLDLKPKVEKALLEKIDKLEKKLKKKNDSKFIEKLEKVIQKAQDNKGKFKKFSQLEKDVLLVTINSLLDSLK